MPVKDAIAFWDEIERKGKQDGNSAAAIRLLALSDLFYLLVRVCGRVDLLPCVGRPGFVDNQFAFERCREVEANPDGCIDLWAREHNKSTIITFGLTIQDILKDPEVTFGIYSQTRPIAKAFLRQIMLELEQNKTLIAAFPDVLWSNTKDAPKWSEDEGIVVRRKTNPKESTVEAWGLVDSQPTSKHHRVIVYDDVVVAQSVNSPEMIQKTMLELERSYNLGTTPGIKRMVGTRWHFNDAYHTVVERGTFVPREYPGRVGGTEDGESIYWSEETHLAKRKEQGPYTYAAQILLNPKADSAQGFKREWLRHYKQIHHIDKMTGYILVDAASSKKKGSDYTSIRVWGLNIDKNRYLLDAVRDRLNLKERGDRLFALHRKWSAMGLKIQQVRYEKYGLMADIEHLQSRMEDENYRFRITEVGGVTSKVDRIKRLIPLYEQGRIWQPECLWYTDWQGQTVDLVRAYVEEEYMAFPFGLHDDSLDADSRMEEPDLRLLWPMEENPMELPPPVVRHEAAVGWMA